MDNFVGNSFSGFSYFGKSLQLAGPLKTVVFGNPHVRAYAKYHILIPLTAPTATPSVPPPVIQTSSYFLLSGSNFGSEIAKLQVRYGLGYFSCEFLTLHTLLICSTPNLGTAVLHTNVLLSVNDQSTFRYVLSRLVLF